MYRYHSTSFDASVGIRSTNSEFRLTCVTHLRRNVWWPELACDVITILTIVDDVIGELKFGNCLKKQANRAKVKVTRLNYSYKTTENTCLRLNSFVTSSLVCDITHL